MEYIINPTDPTIGRFEQEITAGVEFTSEEQMLKALLEGYNQKMVGLELVRDPFTRMVNHRRHWLFKCYQQRVRERTYPNWEQPTWAIRKGIEL